MANTDESLARFIRQNLETVPIASSFSIWMVEAETGGKSRIDRFEVGPFRDAKQKASELRDALMSRAKDQAQAMMHITRFAIFARTKKDESGPKSKETYKAKFEFCLRGEAARAMGLTSMESEPPTERGMLAQMMRHNEALMRMTVEGMGQITEQMTEQLRVQSERATNAEKVQIEYHARVSEMNEGEHKRKMEAMKELNRQERLNGLSDQATKLLLPAVAQSIPSLLSHFGFGGAAKAAAAASSVPSASATSADSPPSPPSPETEAVEAEVVNKSDAEVKIDKLKDIFMSLPQEEIESILRTLSPEKAKELTGIFVG